MPKSDDKAKREELAKAVLQRMKAAGALTTSSEPVNRVALKKTQPTLALILNEYVMSKSWRTDPKSTAKQVAEALVARDKSSRLAGLLTKLESELASAPPQAPAAKKAAGKKTAAAKTPSTAAKKVATKKKAAAKKTAPKKRT